MPVRPTTRNVAGVSGLIGNPVVIWPEERRLGDLNRRHAKRAADLRHDRQRPEIERVRIEQQAEGHGQQAEQERQVLRHGRGDRADRRVRHGGQHPRFLHDPGERAGGEQDRRHHQRRRRVRVDALALKVR